MLARKLAGTLQQARMQVEDVAGVGLASRRTAKRERHLTVGDGLLGKVIVNDEGVLAVIAVELGHCAAGVCRNVLQGRGIGRRG